MFISSLVIKLVHNLETIALKSLKHYLNFAVFYKKKHDNTKSLQHTNYYYQ